MNQRYRLDPRYSSLVFTCGAPSGRLSGRFGEVGGTVELSSADLATVTDLWVEVRSLDLSGGHGPDPETARLAHDLLGQDLLNLACCPRITWSSGSVMPATPGTFRASGALTLQRVTRELSLLVTFHGRNRDSRGKEGLKFTATATFRPRDFGLAQLPESQALVGDVVTVRCDAYAEQE